MSSKKIMSLVVVASLKFVINQKRKWLRVKVKVVDGVTDTATAQNDPGVNYFRPLAE